MAHSRSTRATRVLRWLTALIVVLASSASAQPAPRRVLLLHACEAPSAPLDVLASSLQTDLAEIADSPLHFVNVPLQPLHNPESSDPKPVVDYVHALFAAQPPDLVLSIGGPAVQFAQEHRADLFPQTPMILAGVARGAIDEQRLTERDATVTFGHDPRWMIENILRLRPDTTTIFVVVGTSPFEQAWRTELAADFQPFSDRLTVIWSDRLTGDEVLTRAAALPADAAILYVLWAVDAAGIPHSEDRVLSDLHAVAHVPLFGFYSSQLGQGIVGGPLLDLDLLSRNTATAANRLLHGEPADGVRVSVQYGGHPVFDWRELQKWQIAETLLPAGSVVRYGEPPAWSRYEVPIVAGIVLCVVEGVLIAALVLTRRERRHAELALAELSRNLMQTQEEERAWIARELHEDLCQRMVALTVQLQLVAAQTSTEGARQVEQISADVQKLVLAAQVLSRRLYASTLELLGISKTAIAYCRELAAQNDVDIDIGFDGDLTDIPSDVALALFRVLQEALHNAIEHSGSRHFGVRLFGGSREFELTVKDDGIGFDVASAIRSHGLGLVALQQRLKLVDGTIHFDSRHGMGTTVRATVPRRAIEPVAEPVTAVITAVEPSAIDRTA